MDIKKLGLSVILTSILVAPAFAQEYKSITRLGVSAPVCDGGVETAQELIDYVSANRADFISLIQASGYQGNPDLIVDSILNGDFNETSIPSGTTFEWMGVRHRSTGQTDVTPYLRWAGNEPVPSFNMTVVDNGMEHSFAIPKICCNIALLGSEPVPVAVAPAPIPVNEVAAAPVEDDPLFLPYVGAFAGYYERNRDNCPPENHHTDGAYLGGLAGIMYPVSESTFLFGQIGGAGDLDESKYGTFFADIGVNQYITDNVFIGGGVGYWDINVHDDDDGTYFVQTGVDTIDVAGGKIQLFAEGRGFMDKDDLGQNWMALGGVRWVYGKK